ncbi:hypothetical protein D9M69_676310 [compost metagenome]
MAQRQFGAPFARGGVALRLLVEVHQELRLFMGEPVKDFLAVGIDGEKPVGQKTRPPIGGDAKCLHGELLSGKVLCCQVTIARRASSHVGRHRDLRAVNAAIDLSAGVGDSAGGGGIALASSGISFAATSCLQEASGVTRDAEE